MIKQILIFLFLLNSLSVSQSQTLKEKLDQLLKDEFFESSLIAKDIYDLTADEYLYRVNSKMLLHPASNMKLFTSIAGLLTLGVDYQFLTSLYYDGEILGSTLYGNLYIEGGCDPEFRTENLSNFILSLKALNINSIVGNIYADLSFKDSLYWGVGWMWDDDPSTDAPYLSALNINGNAVSVTLNGANVGQSAEIILNPNSEFFSVNNQTITVLKKEEEDFYITRNWFNRKNEIIASGKVSLEKENNENGDKQVNVLNPELYFLTLFKETLIQNGISFTGDISITKLPPINKYLGSITTSLMTVLMNVNKNSNNLSAEMVLYAMAEKYFGRPATAENGIKVINELITSVGHNPEEYRIVDGSGVSHYNLISAELILDILKYIYTNEKEVYRRLWETLPIAGIDGTLEKRMTNSSAFNNVRAKTGTLSGVNALSGYVTAANGNQIAFSILIQNHVNKTSEARQFQDEICKILAEYR
ncbi:MAG: D-alanyl-D-alanine carboxypeptidase/D-alanyl-D-alanine-endopeptidase [Ignavibacteriaceae bacterium]|nr:D-alanyl-D-alanine carboxypeptidase/D-alanyl-D-alanine-endopeptidase [Ignavibacteriaceae bacterium]